jgi:DNA-binding transcriptional regulator LsrR (DeoR family)
MKQPKTSANNLPVQGTLVQVARLYFDENLSQQEIATRLGVSRSLIAHYLQHARESGIVRVQIINPASTCTDLAAAVKKATGIKQITVIPNPRGSQTLTLRAVAEAAAAFLTEKLKDGDAFGLAWGRTTAQVVDLLTPPRARRVDVLPLMGESGHSVIHSQMNQMVMLAAQRLRAKAHFLSLPMVVSSASLRKALFNEAGIQDVFGLWGRVNLACVGIGVVPPVPGMIVYIGEEYMPKLVEAGAVGDLCGIYFNREGQIIQSGLENRVIAASLEQLQAIDCLVAVACGGDKAVAVLGAVRTGLISALFIDQDMAEQMLDELVSRPQTPRGAQPRATARSAE